MQNFIYRISVIVPIYNSESFLRDCLNSLLVQTLNREDMEVLLINDGSTDGSLDICLEYAELYDNFFVYSKENEGLSATRNYGIQRARGKYICYLDSDDKYSPETLKNICDYFDLHYDEIDEISYPIVRYKNGKKLKMHYRYNWMKKTGIFDLSSFPFVSQTTINICVKNKGEKNVLFDTTPNFRHEDQAYNNEILKEKQKIGFVKEAEYMYNRDNDSSIVSTYMYPYYIFETTTSYYENLFGQFEKVPQYYQALFIHDLNWKLCGNILYPFHYEKEKFIQAVNRIRNLLAKCDVDTIIHYPELNNFHIQYWLNMKPNCSPVVIVNDKEHIIVADGIQIYSRVNMELIMHKIRVKKGVLRMYAFLKSPIFNHIPEPANVWVVENDNSRKKLKVFPSVHGYYKNTFVYTNKFWAFEYCCNVNEVHSFYFEVELDGFIIKTAYWCMPVAVFDKKRGINTYVRENTQISLIDNRIILNQLTDEKIDLLEHEENLKYENDLNVFHLREMAINYRKEHKIWLYYDAYTVIKDNAYYQFLNDLKHSKEDNVERYYVITNENSRDLFSEELKKYLVTFGSEKHKLLYLACQKVLTAYFGFSPISPFLTEQNESNYIDIIKFETIYLQHGVLHAALRAYNAVERCRAEKIVVSSQFEIDNYINNYHYPREDLIATGMSRYDHIDFTKQSQNRILYAPSWRKYLTISRGYSDWEVVSGKLLDSDYFKNMIEFINSSELHQILKDQDIFMDVKLHPIVSMQSEKLFDIQSDRINFIHEDVDVSDYKLFITDFSSFVFDFAPLKRPIIYFVTDYVQFKSGMNHYKELDLPFEDAFGPLAITSAQVLEDIRKVIHNNWNPEPNYMERMKTFFVDLNNCSEKLYQILINK